jgi:hypothetical protein
MPLSANPCSATSISNSFVRSAYESCRGSSMSIIRWGRRGRKGNWVFREKEDRARDRMLCSLYNDPRQCRQRLSLRLPFTPLTCFTRRPDANQTLSPDHTSQRSHPRSYHDLAASTRPKTQDSPVTVCGPFTCGTGLACPLTAALIASCSALTGSVSSLSPTNPGIRLYRFFSDNSSIRSRFGFLLFGWGASVVGSIASGRVRELERDEVHRGWWWEM